MGQITCDSCMVVKLGVTPPLLIPVHTHACIRLYFHGTLSVGKCQGSLKKHHRVGHTDIAVSTSKATWFIALCYLHSAIGKL